MDKKQAAEIISVLPDKLGRQVVKITLEPNRDLGETARAVLIVYGEVIEHSHAVDKNQESEMYFSVTENIQKGIMGMQIPKIAGENSPTGLKEHAAKGFQIILATKKGQQPGLWQDFSEGFVQYSNKMRFGCSKTGDQFNLISLGLLEKEEFVVYDTKTKKISYLMECKDWRNNIQAEANLNELLQLKKDYGHEMSSH